MKGKIIKYFESKGFGFILDEKGGKRFFHISDTLSPLDIKEFLYVEFEPSENEKGLTSKKIKITDYKTNKKFINIFDTNIKCSNIKQYGISSSTETLYQKQKSLLGIITGDEYQKIVSYEELPYQTIMGPGTAELPIKDTSGYNEVENTYFYLYITTYQGENHKWRGNKNELEAYVANIRESLEN